MQFYTIGKNVLSIVRDGAQMEGNGIQLSAGSCWPWKPLFTMRPTPHNLHETAKIMPLFPDWGDVGKMEGAKENEVISNT